LFQKNSINSKPKQLSCYLTLTVYMINKKNSKCPICDGNSDYQFLVQTINPNTNEKVEVRICAQCRHRWINPLPPQKQLNQLYRTASLNVIGLHWDEEIKHKGLSPAESRVLSLIQRSKPSSEKNYLEVGIGSGTLFKKTKDLGLGCYGIEPGKWHNEKNIFEDISTMPFRNFFHFIVCIDVLEHMENPVNFLDEIKSFARTSSNLYCQFPNGQSLEAIIRRKRWPMLRPYGHLHYFSYDSTLKMFEKSGWKLLSLHHTGTTKFRGAFRGLGSLARYFFERIGMGDQWFVEARME
jgi:2-polyprenyl-3-methyl-5-hydroxy-6-metoxy-1,4-benzoquinol methylase